MKPKQFFFGVLGGMLLLVGGGGYGYYYALNRLHGQTANLAEKMAEEKAAEEQLVSLDKLNHQYNRDVKPSESLIETFLPRSKQQSEILAQIERIAVQVGVLQPFESVTMPGPSGLPTELSQTSKDGVVLSLPINFKAKGTYAQLQSFIYRLETLNRYTNVTNLDLEHNSKKDPVSYTFSLNAYIKP